MFLFFDSFQPRNVLLLFLFSMKHFYLVTDIEYFKGALLSLRQFLATLKTMKNAFYFTLKALSVLKIFKLLS